MDGFNPTVVCSLSPSGRAYNDTCILSSLLGRWQKQTCLFGSPSYFNRRKKKIYHPEVIPRCYIPSAGYGAIPVIGSQYPPAFDFHRIWPRSS